MDVTPPRERDQIWLPLTPARQRCGPFSRAAELVDVLAGHDHAAVDDSRRDRRELARRDGRHRLVEQTQPALDVSVPEEDLPLREERKAEQVAVAEPSGDLGCRGGRLGGAFPVALGLVLDGNRHQHVSVLDALLVLAIEETLGPAEPARCRPHLAAYSQLHPDPEGTARGPPECLCLFMAEAGALKCAPARFLVAEHVDGRRKQLEVVGSERRLLISTRKRLSGVCPG
jgi:hypothetical protein